MSLVETIEEFARLLPSLRLTSERVSPKLDGWVQAAVSLKREGDYAGASRIYLMLATDSGFVHSGLMMSWYKTVACSGFLAEAVGLLGVGHQAYETNPAPLLPGLRPEDNESAFLEHHRSLRLSLGSIERLETYLSPLSGQPDYRFPRDYDVEVARAWIMYERGRKK